MKEKAGPLEKTLRVLLIPATIGGLAILNHLHEPEGSSIPELTEDYIVKPGDTSWDIANRFLPENSNTIPLSDVIDSQPAAQDGLQVGETIRVPKQKEKLR